MKNRLTLCFLLLFVTGFCQESPLATSWQKLYTGNTSDHHGNVVLADKSSGVYVWGDANPLLLSMIFNEYF